MSSTRQTNMRIETHVKADILDHLGRDPDYFIWNHPTGTFFTKRGDPVRCGLPGSSDIIGCVRVTVTPEMVGRQIGVALGVEVKHPTTGGQREDQKQFEQAWKDRGGIYVLARTEEGLKDRIMEAVR